ncbi:ribonuclease Y-like [Saccostrea cucullata]|uniref:ribonuclease Y-like n=1 Tax=Saccostrea cuccullata TaxID=36930 RepID=UPI002ED10900
MHTNLRNYKSHTVGKVEKISEKPWQTELRNQGEKIAADLKIDFNKHLQNAEKILSERDKMLDKKEKNAKEKSDSLDKREKDLKAKEKELAEKLDMLETEKRILEEDRTKLDCEKEKWKAEEEVLFTKYRIKDNILKLKVGEKMFETYQTTVMKDPNSMLAIRFSGRHDPVLVDGAHFFDRDPKYFEYILNYLRDGSITAEILPKNKDELYKILKEADYYQLQGLKGEIEKIIEQSSSNIEEAAKMTMGRDTMTREMRRIAQDTMRTYSAEMRPDEQKGKRNKTGAN